VSSRDHSSWPTSRVQRHRPNIVPIKTKSQINEVLRKGAEDTSLLLKMAGEGAREAFQRAAEMHKKYAPAPKEQPLEVDSALRDK
jgi:hypothetical protein